MPSSCNLCSALDGDESFTGVILLFLLSVVNKRRRRCGHADLALVWLINASRSALIWSALVVGIPCGKPGYTLSVAPFTSFEDCKAAAPMGTIWSSSP